MKNRLLLFVLFFSVLSYGQQGGKVVLNWKDNVFTYIGEDPFTMPQFQDDYMGFDPSVKQLFLLNKFEVSASVNPESLQVTDVVYETITTAQLGGLAIAGIPTAINATLTPSLARTIWYASLRLSPIIKEGSGYKRIKSFSYTYSYGGAAMQRSTQATAAISNSVLASGEWVRFYVEKSGVYRLSRSFLQQIGVNVNADPRTIKIYGNGGRMAPLLNSLPYPQDLAENAVKFIGEEDGRFDNNDYILFYAEGVDNWNTESGTHSNLYADRSYYYVTSQGGTGKRIRDAVQPTAAATTQTSVFDDYQYYEKDLVNIARLGRKWHGEQFNIDNEQQFTFAVPDIANQPVSISVSAAATSASSSSMAVTANGASVGSLTFQAVGPNISAQENFLTGTFPAPADGTITINLAYNNGGVPAANAWLDYIILQSKRNLDGNGRQFRFRYNDAALNTGVIQYNFTSAAGIAEVWDITDIYNATKITNASGAQFSFKASQGEVRQYIAVESSDHYAPLRESNTRVANQDLKGTIFRSTTGQFQDIDYLIITPAFLNATAETLAAYHRNRSGLNVKVVNLENIYQEFSAGKQDIAAIRNFIKYVYTNASTPEKRVKYVNLFGDASFDYKNRIRNNSNIVPIFHGYSPVFSGSLNYSIVYTFCTDDFYGLMDDNEGRLSLPAASFAEAQDIAVGRMLVKDRAQAEQMVNKVFEYESPEAYGRWRNEFITAVDDLDGDGSSRFVYEVEDSVVARLQAARPYVNIRKFYLDSYVQQSSAGGQRYPDAKEQFIRAINYGALVVNFFGHGGELGMASERLFETSDAQNLTNRYKYPLFITATCDVTKFDNPFIETAGENIYWNPTGGAIAMITTTRALFISSANTFNPEITRRLYAYGQNEYPTMAEAMRLAKVTNGNADIRMICFIGDPALKMAIPKPNVLLTTINDVPIAQSTDVLQSLARVKLGGVVTDINDNMLSGYNGDVEVTVFDKQIAKTTLVNDVIPDANNVPIPFNTLGETIFRGSAVVTNGRFEFSFVVPRDIRIPVGEGRVSFYSKRNNVLEDHMGYNNVLRVGGINTSAPADNTAPNVKLYMNTETFISGGITNASPILLAYLEDANGINTASGIGHDIIGILDGDDSAQYLMNDYYEADANDYSHGTVRFPFANLTPGLHTLTFRAWDVYNNLVSAEIQFVVSGGDNITLEKVLNYPNPFVSYTEFWFSHNRPFEPLDVQVQVFTVTGKIVKTINQSVTTDGFLSREIKWDGRDDFGNRIGKGVYIYKLTVKSTSTNKKAEKYEKLVLL
jgi:hypothetical protein